MAIAKPVYVAPAKDLSAAVLPCSPGRADTADRGFHPLIVPSSVAKMKIDDADAGFPVTGFTPETVNALLPAGSSVATIPVGVPERRLLTECSRQVLPVSP